MRLKSFVDAHPSLLVAAAGAVVLLPFRPALAQETGAVAGRVLAAESLEPVPQAQVFIPGTDIGTLASEDGSYRLTGVPAGEVQVRVRFLGYATRTRTVAVPAGQTAELDFRLEATPLSMQEIVVTTTGARKRLCSRTRSTPSRPFWRRSWSGSGSADSAPRP